MKTNLFALTAAALLFVVAPVVAGDKTTVAYPTKDNLEFSVEIPSDFKLIPQGSEGAEEYFEVEGPNGLELSFRTIEGSDIEKAIEEHMAYLKETFTDVKPGETKEITLNGQEAVLLPAQAKDEAGSARDIGAGWFLISDTRIGEFWWNVKEGDEAGTKAAIDALNSIKVPKK